MTTMKTLEYLANPFDRDVVSPLEPTGIPAGLPRNAAKRVAKKKATGFVIYRGPSLIDGSPIAVIALVKSGNAKTGNMVQTYIIRADVDPREASRTGADFAICGNCPHRGEAVPDDPDAKQAKRRSCYVLLGQGPLIVYRSMVAGKYVDVAGHDAIAEIGRGRMVRLGTYGDGAAVPDYIWTSLISDAAGHTAYTHQAGRDIDFDRSRYMVSADTLSAAQAAWAEGRRTFRVVSSVADIQAGREILCPASKEAGARVQCHQCKLCGGDSAAKSIAIPAHGSGKKHAGAAQ